MREASLTVIVPTLGRATLDAALVSCRGADEVIVCADTAGNVEAAQTVTARHGARFLACPADEHRQGYAQREHAIRHATGSHLCFLDDDDEFTPAAASLFRQAACDVPVIFRMLHHELGVVWDEPVLRYGNVGTPMLLVPNQLGRLGHWHPHVNVRWGPIAGGDYTFIRETVERMGGPVWRPEIVAVIRPGPDTGREWTTTNPDGTLSRSSSS